MSVIKTKRNFVCAYEPLAEDRFVDTWIGGEPHRYRLLTQPIHEYSDAVAFAVRMADQMAWPIEVIPITSGEYLARIGVTLQ